MVRTLRNYRKAYGVRENRLSQHPRHLRNSHNARLHRPNLVRGRGCRIKMETLMPPSVAK